MKHVTAVTAKRRRVGVDPDKKRFGVACFKVLCEDLGTRPHVLGGCFGFFMEKYKKYSTALF